MLIAMDDNLDWYPHAFIMSDSKWDPAIVEKEYIYDNNDSDDALLLCLQDGHDLCIDAYRTTFSTCLIFSIMTMIVIIHRILQWKP